MGGVRRGPGEIKIEGIRVVDNPEHVRAIARLESELKAEREKPAKIEYVDRHIEKVVERQVEDKAILERLNAALKENSELKKFQPKTQFVEKPVDRIIEKEVIKYVDRIVPAKKNHKLTAGAAVAGLLMGLGLMAPTHKDVKPCQTSSISQTLKQAPLKAL